jgi:CBS domain-containing protein
MPTWNDVPALILSRRNAMNVATILKHKGADVASVGPDATLQEAVGLLAGKRIGAALVLDAARKILGIVSERDIVKAVATHGAACLPMPVTSVMTSTVETCRPSDTIDQLMAQMTAGRFRHVPVVEAGQLVGIVSIGDVVKLRIAESELEVSAIREYIAAH